MYDGRPSPDFPCDPDANVSSCCGGGSKCVTNLYCTSPYDQASLVIGTCTDRSWESVACPFKLGQLLSCYLTSSQSSFIRLYFVEPDNNTPQT